METKVDHTNVLHVGGGTLLTIVINVQVYDVVKTAFLAAIGAAVSFIVTVVLKLLCKKIKKVCKS
jgi:ABC-type sulfate transport system permease component